MSELGVDQATSPCHLLSLPLEILHVVFDALDKRSVLTARETCVTLAAVGSEYMLHEVTAVYKRERLQRLVSIAQHATIRKNVRSLYWQADRFSYPPLNFKTWNQARAVARPWSEYNIYHELPLLNDPTLNAATPRAQRAFARANKRYDRNMKGQHTQSELDAAFSSYQALAQDQIDVAASSFDYECFATFFRACPKLDSVTIGTTYGTSGYKDAGRMAFKEAMMSPYGDCTNLDQGVHQFWTIAGALLESQLKVKHLTVTDVSYRLLRSHVGGESVEPMMNHLMGSLHEFRLGITVNHDEIKSINAGLNLHFYNEASSHHSTGLLAKWLSAAPHLRVLKLRMYNNHLDENTPSTELKDIVGTTTWPKLRELGLNHMSATEDELVDLLLRHKDSLRRLSLSFIFLEQGSWTGLVDRIGGALPKLKKVRLRGDLADLQSGIYEFAIPGFADGHDEYPLQEAMEKFILYGGEGWDVEDFIVPEPNYAINMWDPELPFNFERSRVDDEDAGYTTDCSAISYGSDGFDGTI